MKASLHRKTTALVSLSAIQNNIKKIQKHIGEKPEIWAVVKANAYGHGVLPVAHATQDLVNGFCVSNLDEALELREGLITKPILVLSGISPESGAVAAVFDIILTAPSLEWLSQLVKEKIDFSRLKVHIAVDSGMGRVGVREASEANQMIELMDRYDIQFDGIFTHFATADEADEHKFNQQKNKFSEILNDLIRQPKYIHSTNTASALWHKEQVQDIERLGISMYGLNPSGETLALPFEIEPALSLVSELTHVKQIDSGDTLGYGATYTAKEKIWVGTLPIGYADGWTRDMQGFHVLVNGKYCEIIGRVSMDQMTIQLDQSYPIGTPVTLIGKNGNEEITAQDVAKWRKTINYEVVCLLSDRIRRKYL